jgi:hypothetical protein
MNKEEINEQRRLRYHNKTDEEKERIKEKDRLRYHNKTEEKKAIVKEKKKEYYKNNIEHSKENSKEYRKNNIERIKEKDHLRYHNKTEEKKAIVKEKKKEYYKNNIENLKEYRKNNIEKIKERKKEYRKTDNGIKSRVISTWKTNGLILESNEAYNELYEKYLLSTHCEQCHVPLITGNISKNKKTLDHNHKTGAFRNVICHKCNVKRGFQDKIDDPDYNILYLQKKEHLIKRTEKQNAKACEKYKNRTEEEIAFDKAKRKIYRENKKLNKNEIKI